MIWKSIRVAMYRFLFSAERARTPLRALSGGERSRVQLACLFSQPANVLVLDEPTNDLDMETLELLESILVDFTGTVLLVSHDREFMDNVVTSSLAFEGRGVVREYVGGYQDWIRQGGHFSAEEPLNVSENTNASSGESTSKQAPGRKKLSYKLQRELEALPETIEQLENQQQQLQTVIADPDFYQQDHEQVSSILSELAKVESDLDAALERWMELSEE